MLNKCCFIGNVGQSPEIRVMSNGKEVANFSLGVTERWKKNGESHSKTEWVRIVCFSEGLVKVIKNYVKKGSKIYVEGQMQTRKWTDTNGVERYSTEIVMQGFSSHLILLDSKKTGDSEPVDEEQYTNPANYANNALPDDEIPFALLAALVVPLLPLMGAFYS